MKAKTIMKSVKLGSLTLVLLVCTLSGNAQKKELLIDSLSTAFSEVFIRPFTLDPNMALGCQNSAKESYDGNAIPPVPGQAHYHARLKMEDDKVLDILRLETIINDFLELVERADSKAYLNEIGADRFWVEEVQVANVHYLVVGIDWVMRWGDSASDASLWNAIRTGLIFYSVENIYLYFMIDANASHSLSRFIEAQNTVYDQVLWELNSGKKSSHWMWFIFPQMKGLGMSSVSNFYGISGIEVAMLYWNHDLLGTRIRECIAILLALPEKDANKIFGYTDAMKLRSCLTLFNLVDDSSERWTEKCLQQYFAGIKDKRTLLLLGV